MKYKVGDIIIVTTTYWDQFGKQQSGSIRRITNLQAKHHNDLPIATLPLEKTNDSTLDDELHYTADQIRLFTKLDKALT